MKRILLAALIWGWFFQVYGPYGQVPGAFVRLIVGPFKTEMECKSERGKLVDVFADVKEADVSPCTFIVES